jgi:hypothetical protein
MEISSIFVGFALFVVSLAYVSLPFRQKQLKTASIPASAQHKRATRRRPICAA